MSSAEDLEGGVREPLLPRTSRLQQRQQFQRSRQQVVVNVATSGRGILARLLITLFLAVAAALVLLWLYLYMGSLQIIVYHLDAPCDQPLGAWLVVWMILPTVHALVDAPPPREDGNEEDRRRHNARSSFIHCIWFAVGCFWFRSSKTCSHTNESLYVWVRFVIHIYLVGVFLFFVFPLMLAFLCLQLFKLYQWLIDRGWISNPKAAKAGTIESMEVVTYDPSLFAKEDDPHDTRPSGECCCCQEDFNAESTIVCTPCQHYYHKHCLAEWLKLAHSCPLCRSDLNCGESDESKDEGESESSAA